jgi:hypothetical protein
MRKLVNYLLAVFFITSPLFGFAQTHRIKIVAEIPVQFGIGYEGQVSERFSVSVQGGVLTDPNSDLIINVLEKFGTDPDIILIIEDAFQFGLVGEFGVNYNFGKNYVGVFSQFINLRGNGTTADPIENYFDTTIPVFPGNGGNTDLKLRSSLIQGGLLYGRRFPLRNRHFEIDAEFGFSANLWSKSELSSERRNMNELSKQVDSELDYYYSNYGFVPSLSVILVYNFL